MNYQQALEAKRAELLAGRDRSAVYVNREADETDNARALAEREMAATMSNVDAAILRQVNAALERLDSGQFGFCQECEEPIAEKRLRAILWATRCRDCQERIEAKERMAGRRVDLFDELEAA